MPDSAKPVLVSACLLGKRCRYDGRSAETPELEAQLEGRKVVAVCPEELGELGTPRPPAKLVDGDGGAVLDGQARVLTDAGDDVTKAFVSGAERVLEIARWECAEEAILKARSPSCGAGSVHGDGGLVAGDGVTAAALKRIGVSVRSVG